MCKNINLVQSSENRIYKKCTELCSIIYNLISFYIIWVICRRKQLIFKHLIFANFWGSMVNTFVLLGVTLMLHNPGYSIIGASLCIFVQKLNFKYKQSTCNILYIGTIIIMHINNALCCNLVGKILHKNKVKKFLQVHQKVWTET